MNAEDVLPFFISLSLEKMRERKGEAGGERKREREIERERYYIRRLKQSGQWKTKQKNIG